MSERDLAIGWYEFIHPSRATTNIACIGEYGLVYIPEAGITVDDFFEALLAGKAFKLVREYQNNYRQEGETE